MILREGRKESGFTLIELIIVIVILGILAVVAVPKFLSLSVEAEKGVAKGITAGFRGAITALHSRYLLDNSQTYDATSVTNQIDEEGLTLSAAAAVITATFNDSGNAYTWNYTARSGNTPAKIAGPN